MDGRLRSFVNAAKLLASFDAGRGLVELAAAHERTQTGIRARLVKYGRLAA